MEFEVALTNVSSEGGVGACESGDVFVKLSELVADFRENLPEVLTIALTEYAYPVLGFKPLSRNWVLLAGTMPTMFHGPPELPS